MFKIQTKNNEYTIVTTYDILDLSTARAYCAKEVTYTNNETGKTRTEYGFEYLVITMTEDELKAHFLDSDSSAIIID